MFKVCLNYRGKELPDLHKLKKEISLPDSVTRLLNLSDMHFILLQSMCKCTSNAWTCFLIKIAWNSMRLPQIALDLFMYFQGFNPHPRANSLYNTLFEQPNWSFSDRAKSRRSIAIRRFGLHSTQKFLWSTNKQLWNRIITSRMFA